MIAVPDPLTKSWLKRLSDEELWELYNHMRAVDDYLSYGDSSRINTRLLRVRDIMQKRGLL